jgi:hypothetical protein
MEIMYKRSAWVLQEDGTTKRMPTAQADMLVASGKATKVRARPPKSRTRAYAREKTRVHREELEEFKEWKRNRAATKAKASKGIRVVG